MAKTKHAIPFMTQLFHNFDFEIQMIRTFPSLRPIFLKSLISGTKTSLWLPFNRLSAGSLQWESWRWLHMLQAPVEMIATGFSIGDFPVISWKELPFFHGKVRWGLNDKLLEPPAMLPSPNEALSGSPLLDFVELAEGAREPKVRDRTFDMD